MNKRQIIKSSTEPSTDDLWLHDGVLKQYGPNGWEAITSSNNSVSEEYIKQAIEALKGAAPESLDTLEEIADKLENNDKIIEALVDELYHKADKEEVNQALTNIIEALEAIDLTNYETKVNAQQTYLKKTDLTPISDEELDEILV